MGVISLPSSEEEKDESIESTPAAKEETKALKKASKEKTNLETNANELKKAIDAANSELSTKENVIQTRIKAANDAISSMKTAANSSVNDIESRMNEASGDIDNAFKQIKLMSKIIPIVVFIVYTLAYWYQYGLVLDAMLWGGLIVAAIVAVLLKVIADRLRFDLDTKKQQAVETIKTTREGLGSFLTTKLGITPNLQRVKTSFTNAADYGSVIISSVRDYIPALEKVYSNKERMNRQLVFIKTIRNAMSVYGFELGPKANDYLSHFGPLTESEDEWLEESANKLKPIIGISQPILKLVYFDYTGDDQPLKNSWKEILSKPKLLSELGKIIISNELVDTEYIEKNVETYGAIEELMKGDEPFKLDDFRSRYNIYYIDLAREKRTLVDGVRDYGFKIGSTLGQKILKYTPPTFEPEQRLNALITFTAQQTGLNNDIVKLAYFERESDSSKRSQIIV